MTLKAVRILKAADVIACPGKTPEESTAYKIAIRAVPEIAGKERLSLSVPMTKDQSVLEKEHIETALALARAANYIDFGAMNHVDEDTCLGLLEGAALRKDEREVFRHLMAECSDAQRFLLITDNCGEIVLDKLFLEQLKKRFPWLKLQVLVRGQEVLNDVTPEDAVYAGICRIAEIISNGKAIAGTVYDMLPDEARRALDRVDVIFAKGQGNYESLSGQGRHIYYTFLCKCDLFTSRFSVPPLTGMLVEE